MRSDELSANPAPREKEKLLGAVGICRKAGKLVIGTDAVCEALAANRKPRAVFAASDVSGNTAKRLRDRCGYYGVELWVFPVTGEELARAVGKTGKCAAGAVTDEQLCRLLRGAYEKISMTTRD